MIPFNKPYVSGVELEYISDAIKRGKISGDGYYTKKCSEYIERKYGFEKVLLTTSCTDALEMAAILLDIKPGDEVISPSYTFVSTVNAFALRGAKIRFVDSCDEHPNISCEEIERNITNKTRAIVIVHYAGVACDMDKICAIANKYNIPLVEDAAQAIDSYYNEKPLGSFGTMAAFSFHETKNIICGEGSMLVVNDRTIINRAEIIREKGTNRTSFFRGEINKYGWVDIGSSFLPSELNAAYLYGQLENLENIQSKRKILWNEYYAALKKLEDKKLIKCPIFYKYSTNNAHMFYIVCRSIQERSALISFLKDKGIQSVFHYLSLHKSDFYLRDNKLVNLPNCDMFQDKLLRLPLYYELTIEQVTYICSSIFDFYKYVE